MPIAAANGIDLFYDVRGPDDGDPVLLVMGLGAQYHLWDEAFVDDLVERGYRVVRFDNRDVGLSTKIDVGDLDPVGEIMKLLTGGEAQPPYLLSDMADDAVGLIDVLGIDEAHVVGASMGGMIAQSIAIAHPRRVKSLTSIMSTTGDPDVGQPDPSVLGALLTPAPDEREAAIAQSVDVARVISNSDYFDEADARRRAEIAFDRCHYPQGVVHQLVAIVASGSRSEALSRLDIPTLVIHGDVDPLVTPSGGIRTAEVIPGAELWMVPNMGHEFPKALFVEATDRITALAAEGNARRAATVD